MLKNRNYIRYDILSLLLLFLGFSCTDKNKTEENWQLGPFEKFEENPILTPRGTTWESKDLFNPAAWSDGETVYMLYRAEDSTGIGDWNGTSRIGLATSTDGINFTRNPNPVLEPTEPWELPGGTEDPRVVKIDDMFYLTYTAYDGETARLALASSPDLQNWTKHGLLFPEMGWTKAGAIIPVKIDDKYWMYFEDTNIWIAWSKDLIQWTPIEEPVVKTRESIFDSRLIEPGPTPLVTDKGILLLYNAADDDLVYRSGQVLFNRHDPARIQARSNSFFLEPDRELEIGGQIPNVVFIEGLDQLDRRYFLYYGMGDSGIGVAIHDPKLN